MEVLESYILTAVLAYQDFMMMAKAGAVKVIKIYDKNTFNKQLF